MKLLEPEKVHAAETENGSDMMRKPLPKPKLETCKQKPNARRRGRFIGLVCKGFPIQLVGLRFSGPTRIRISC